MIKLALILEILRGGVMVARRSLEAKIGVQIPAPQPNWAP